MRKRNDREPVPDEFSNATMPHASGELAGLDKPAKGRVAEMQIGAHLAELEPLIVRSFHMAEHIQSPSIGSGASP